MCSPTHWESEGEAATDGRQPGALCLCARTDEKLLIRKYRSHIHPKVVFLTEKCTKGAMWTACLHLKSQLLAHTQLVSLQFLIYGEVCRILWTGMNSQRKRFKEKDRAREIDSMQIQMHLYLTLSSRCQENACRKTEMKDENCEKESVSMEKKWENKGCLCVVK